MIMMLYEMNIINTRFIQAIIKFFEDGDDFLRFSECYKDVKSNYRNEMLNLLGSQSKLLDEINAPEVISDSKKDEIATKILNDTMAVDKNTIDELNNDNTSLDTMLMAELLSVSTNFIDLEDSNYWQYGDITSDEWKKHILELL